MIGSCELKARVEESLGTVLDPDFFGQAEQYARRKLRSEEHTSELQSHA